MTLNKPKSINFTCQLCKQRKPNLPMNLYHICHRNCNSANKTSYNSQTSLSVMPAFPLYAEAWNIFTETAAEWRRWSLEQVDIVPKHASSANLPPPGCIYTTKQQRQRQQTTPLHDKGVHKMQHAADFAKSVHQIQQYVK